MRGLNIPFTQMGKVSSTDLFEEREQEIFDLYELLGRRYKMAVDIGANLGVHTILMGRQGWVVRAYEPDPVHYAMLARNIELNPCGDVTAINVAVSTDDSHAEFVRVLDNTTASHIAGARGHHGPVERIRVPTINGPRLFGWNDFAKIDCEGHEAAILCATNPNVPCEFLVEVGSLQNAAAIYRHFNGKRPMYAQHSGWGPVYAPHEMPTHYSHGALFIGEKWC